MSVYRTVYKTVNKTANKTANKTVYKTVYKTVNKTVYNTVHKTVNKTVYKTVNKAVYMTAYTNVYNMVKKTENKTVYNKVNNTVYKTVYRAVYKTVQRALFALFKSERRWSGSVVGCIVILQVSSLTPAFCRRETANSTMPRHPTRLASDTPMVDYGESMRFLSGKDDIYAVLRAFTPMTKQELMKFAEDLRWVKIRRISLIGVVVFLLALVAICVLLLILLEKCPIFPHTTWLQEATIYQIFPRSFVDTDRDGIGDIKGKLVLFIPSTATVTGRHVAAISLTCTDQFSPQHF